MEEYDVRQTLYNYFDVYFDSGFREYVRRQAIDSLIGKSDLEFYPREGSLWSEISDIDGVIHRVWFRVLVNNPTAFAGFGSEDLKENPNKPSIFGLK